MEVEDAVISELLGKAGRSGTFSLTLLDGGANNRVFRLDNAGESLLLKSYFHHPDDPRDRLGAEFMFLSYAWDNGIRTIPQPLACDQKNNLGLYEYIEGHSFEPGEVSDIEVNTAIVFFQQLNQSRDTLAAKQLGEASESCFNFQDHMQSIGARIDRLLTISSDEPINKEALVFVKSTLLPAFHRHHEDARQTAHNNGLSLTLDLARNDRCLSPSDFGFHNAIRQSDGTIKFIDFEYAGWDDPAKVACDFFSQPACPVPIKFRESFIGAIGKGVADKEQHQQRITILEPFYRIKWCAIMLNEFLPVDNERRQFSINQKKWRHRKKDQLAKAQCYFNTHLTALDHNA